MLGMLRQYATANFGRSREPVGSRDALRGFLESRASFVAQTSLFGRCGFFGWGVSMKISLR